MHFTYVRNERDAYARGVRVTELLVLQTSDHEVLGLNLAEGGIQLWLYGASLHRAFHYHPTDNPL